MSLIITDATLLAQLEQAKEPVALCAPDGRVLAYATPTKPELRDLKPQISEEEIRRRGEAGGGRKLADILRDLEKRA